MCTTGISYQVMSDPNLQELVSRKKLDLVHQQLVMVLYTLEHEKRLHEYRQMLPIYRGKNWAECEQLLEVLETAGIVKRSAEGIELPLHIHVHEDVGACACGT